jgi:hypothetical protein
MKDKIVPIDYVPPEVESHYDLLLQGKIDFFEGKIFKNWTVYLSEVVGDTGVFKGTVIFVPNVKKDDLFV